MPKMSRGAARSQITSGSFPVFFAILAVLARVGLVNKDRILNAYNRRKGRNG